MNGKISFNRRIIIPIIIFIVVYTLLSRGLNLFSDDINMNKFKELVDNKRVYTVEVIQNKEVPTGRVEAILYQNNEKVGFNIPDVKKFVDYAQESKLNYKIYDIPAESWFLDKALPIILGALALGFILMMILAPMRGESGSAMNFGKLKAKVYYPGDSKINFSSVAGLKEEKEEVTDIVKFLKNPQAYTKAGARIPKGTLLVGPAGTGKTLLAKAIAGEAGVPFFSTSGSDFVEMFVGVGASRVRDLFAQAKKNAPCLVFIDEIDAVGRKRGAGLGGGHDEREHTLNQLLVEMDGFESTTGVIVMAATNRVDILDSAILRAGRFDRKVGVGKPDVLGREEILKVHSRNKAIGEDVDFHEIALTTSGFTGADLENLMNEAAIISVNDNRGIIMAEDIKKAFIKVGIGMEKKSRVVSQKEREITAYHEAGHAILFHKLEGMGPVNTISIIPTGMGAAGYTMPTPKGDFMFKTKSELEKDIMVSLGGRIAEEIIFGDVTTGASQDIKQVTATARAMVMKYGMSEKLGLINYDDSESNIFIGNELSHARTYGENIASDIDFEVKRIVNEGYKEAREILEESIDVLHKTAKLLLEKDRINQKEFEALFDEDIKEDARNI